jgi:uncharacterized protein DUF6438
MKKRTLLVSCLVVVFSQLLAGQTYPLSEVEVRLVRTPHGGCFGPCVRYEVVVRGDGTVEYNGVGLVEGTRARTISIDEVVALVNEFLRARFFDALETYRNPPSTVVRKGDSIILYGAGGGSDDPQADLTLRLGDRTKTLTLFSNYPAELGRLPELVDRIGGPQVWQRR